MPRGWKPSWPGAMMLASGTKIRRPTGGARGADRKILPNSGKASRTRTQLVSGPVVFLRLSRPTFPWGSWGANRIDGRTKVGGTAMKCIRCRFVLFVLVVCDCAVSPNDEPTVQGSGGETPAEVSRIVE